VPSDSPRLQRLLAISVVVVAAVTAVQPATSSRREGERGFGGSRVYAFPEGRGGITLDAGDLDSAITIASDDVRKQFVITDEAGIKVDGRFPQWESLCQQISQMKVRCALHEPGGIRVDLGDGDDSLRVDSTHNAPVVVGGDFSGPGDDVIRISNPPDAAASRIQGYGGDDVIVAGPSSDFLKGGPGDDLLRGEAGNDYLAGKRGADAHIAGPGDDRIEADRGDEDLDIRCGSGKDSATFDLRLDPMPERCEDADGPRT
jgi:Ca2+-binding RTX toxin-like protein